MIFTLSDTAKGGGRNARRLLCFKRLPDDKPGVYVRYILHRFHAGKVLPGARRFANGPIVGGALPCRLCFYDSADPLERVCADHCLKPCPLFLQFRRVLDRFHECRVKSHFAFVHG